MADLLLPLAFKEALTKEVLFYELGISEVEIKFLVRTKCSARHGRLNSGEQSP